MPRSKYVLIIRTSITDLPETLTMTRRRLESHLQQAGVEGDIEITLVPAGLQGLIDAHLDGRIILALRKVGIIDLTGLADYPDDSLRPHLAGRTRTKRIGWIAYRRCVRALHGAGLSSPGRPQYSRTIESLDLDSDSYRALARTGVRLISDLTSRTFVDWRRETSIPWPYAVKVWEALAKRKLHFTPADDAVTVADLTVLPLNWPTLLISHLAEVGVGPDTPLSRITSHDLVRLRANGRITAGDLERALELCGLPALDRYPEPEAPPPPD
jgi:hypothetical protein